MSSDISSIHGQKLSAASGSLQLPELPECLQAALGRGHTLSIEGTNVVRVPFGVRRAKRERPQRPERWATLVLPLQPLGSPTPPPQAA
ncbi:MAG: hypothetical protein CMN98_04110 [Synechococcus sp. NP17]|jgi:hypothetical protein|nr:hypothetical protein [Synechococcus sp. NP17]